MDGNGNARFSVSQVKDGPWLVVDEIKGRTLVASCPSRDVALMIAALMNGNPEAAIERRKSVVFALDASHAQPEGGPDKGNGTQNVLG
jgi:hypothetical protein